MTPEDEYAAYLSGRVDLAEIVGVLDYSAQRVVSFYVCGAEMEMVEMCDDYYGCTLTVDQVSRLIEWLTARRDEMAAYTEGATA